MAKSVKSLTGAEKDAFLRRAIVEAEAETRAALAERLGRDVSRIWVRQEALDRAAPAMSCADETAVETVEAVPFDPYSPNVIVVVRTAGAGSALAALAAIADIDNLRLLAREQQLGIEAELTTVEEIRIAIVAAAERRIANRRAAAS